MVAEVWADGSRLADLAGLVDSDHLRLPPTRSLPLHRVAQAHEALAAGGLRERLVLIP